VDKKSLIIAILIFGIIILSVLWVRGYQDNRQYRGTIKQLGSELNTYKAINRQLSSQNQQFEQSISKLREQVNQYRKRIAEARKIVEGLSSDTTEISSELQRAIETVRGIKTELQNLRRHYNLMVTGGSMAIIILLLGVIIK